LQGCGETEDADGQAREAGAEKEGKGMICVICQSESDTTHPYICDKCWDEYGADFVNESYEEIRPSDAVPMTMQRIVHDNKEYRRYKPIGRPTGKTHRRK